MEAPLIRSARMFEAVARFQRGTSDSAGAHCPVRARRHRQRKALNSGFWSLCAGSSGACPWRRADLCHRHTLSDLIAAVLAAGWPSAQSIVPMYEQFLRKDAVLQRASAGQAQKFDTRTRLGDVPRGAGADSRRRVGAGQHNGRGVVVVQPDKPVPTRSLSLPVRLAMLLGGLPLPEATEALLALLHELPEEMLCPRAVSHLFGRLCFASRQRVLIASSTSVRAHRCAVERTERSQWHASPNTFNNVHLSEFISRVSVANVSSQNNRSNQKWLE